MNPTPTPTPPQSPSSASTCSTPTLSPITQRYTCKRNRIRNKIYEKIKAISIDEADFLKNCETYNQLMDHSVEEIKEFLKQHNNQYWNGSKKKYQVLHLMKLNKMN
jgi:hypothetical protein